MVFNRRTPLNLIAGQTQSIQEKTFSELRPGQRGRWVELTGDEIADNPEMAQELLDLVNTAYKSIGGNVKFKTLADIRKNASYWVAIDLDSDSEPDATSFAKRKSVGLKSVALGHDGSEAAKKAVLKKKADFLHRPGHYGELSGAIAHLMLKRHGVASVGTKAEVERVIGKKIRWVGEHPNGKYPNHPNWYSRVIAGKPYMKILVGIPSRGR